MSGLLSNIEGIAETGIDMRARLIIGLGAVIVLGAAFTFFAHHYEAKGRQLERADWLAKQVQEQQADAALIAQHQQAMNELEQHHLQIERKTTDDHEKELAQLRLERDADRRRADAAGGLRIPAPACPADSAVSATTPPGASGRDEPASTGTVRLPQQVENDLWAIADDADEVSAQLRSCQAWVQNNGFYGSKPADSGQLIDRMIAEPNHTAEDTP